MKQHKLKLSAAQRKVLQTYGNLPESISWMLVGTGEREKTFCFSDDELAAIQHSLGIATRVAPRTASRSLKSLRSRLSHFPHYGSRIEIAESEVEDSEGLNKTYMQRRVEHVHKLFQNGKVRFAKTISKEMMAEVERQFRAVRKGPDGQIDISTCGRLVRLFAKTAYQLVEASKPPRPEPEITSDRSLADLQCEYFAILEEYVESITGRKASYFSSLEDFHEHLKTHLDSKAEHAHEKMADRVWKFHTTHHSTLYSLIQKLGGVKLVVNSAGPFVDAKLSAVRKMLLYADTVLIPDPILPWFEVDRPEERFSFVWVSHNAFTLLRLKPLVDANLATPPVVVFPSWEKSLESGDPRTQDRISKLAIDFFSHFLGRRFDDDSEIVDFAKLRSAEFLEIVDRKHLFVAPQGVVGTPLNESLNVYRDYIDTFRSDRFVNAIAEQSAAAVVWMSIMERLTPQFHTMDNAATFNAQPLVPVPAAAHYFRLCSEVYQAPLIDNDFLKRETVTSLQSLTTESFDWLSTIPVESLAALRSYGAASEFRRRLAESTSQLDDVALEDIDHVTIQIDHAIREMVSEHHRIMDKLKTSYDAKFIRTLAGVTTAAAVGFRLLTPELGAILIGLSNPSQYVFDKMEQKRQRKSAQRSLIGVIAKAASTHKQ